MRNYIAAALAVGLLTSACGGNFGGVSSGHTGTKPKAPTATVSHPAVHAASVVGGWNSAKADGPALRPKSCSLYPAPASDGAYAVPDAACTPGATTADVTNLNTKATVCNAAFMAKRKPDPKAMQQASATVLAAYGLAGAASKYEVRFLIAPGLGGAFDVRNLWPVPKSTTTATHKTAVDDSLQRAVCGGKAGVQAAQFYLAQRWTSALKEMNVR